LFQQLVENALFLGIIKVQPRDQELYYNGNPMDDSKTLMDCGINTYDTFYPATIGLSLRYFF